MVFTVNTYRVPFLHRILAATNTETVLVNTLRLYYICEKKAFKEKLVTLSRSSRFSEKPGTNIPVPGGTQGGKPRWTPQIFQIGNMTVFDLQTWKFPV